jgi:hypothetical protein
MAESKATHVAWAQWVVLVVLALAAVIAANLLITRWMSPAWGEAPRVTAEEATYDDARYSLAGALARSSLPRAQDETTRAEGALYAVVTEY